MEPADLCRTALGTVEHRVWAVTGQGGRLQSACPGQLLSWRWPWGLQTHSPHPIKLKPNTIQCYNAPSHSRSSACDRPGAAERALRVREREGISRSVGGRPALLPATLWGGFSWSQCQAAPYPSSADPVASAASRTGGGQWGRAHRLQALPRPEGGSSWMHEAEN